MNAHPETEQIAAIVDMLPEPQRREIAAYVTSYGAAWLHRDKVPKDGRSAKRKHFGTGLHDTPPETWRKVRDRYERGAALTDCARAFGVLYSAVHVRACREHWTQDAGTANRRAGYEEGFRRGTLEEGERLRSAGRGRVVRPEADGIAAVIELRPARKEAGPIEVPDDYQPEPSP